jgi:hypothetical protein
MIPEIDFGSNFQRIHRWFTRLKKILVYVIIL